MLNAKRLYLYGVLGVALAILLWGVTSIFRLALQAIGAAAGSGDAVGADVARDELSLAVALVLVAVPVLAVHLWLIRRTVVESPGAAADERASTIRAAYFCLVLTITGAIAVLQLYEVVQQLAGAALASQRVEGLAGATAALIVTGVAWLVHVWWRRSDFLAEPARTANDWLTRAYLYGGLFILAVLLAYWLAEILTVISSELAGARASWEPWQRDIVTPIAGAVGSAVGWSANWILALWLVRADPPLGEAHRASRTRVGYFLAVLLVCSGAALVLVATSLQYVFSEILGVWQSYDGTRLAEDVFGPLLMAVPFVLVGWGHHRRLVREASAFGGPSRFASARRSALYGLAFVGLAGAAIGVAIAAQGMLDYLGASGVFDRTVALRDEVAPGLGFALTGLVLWIPTWRLVRRDRAAEPLLVADSVPRRAYLLLVSALAVVATMVSLAYLAYQLIRAVLDAGPVEDPAWAVSGVVVGGVVLGYHLLLLRADGVILAGSPAPAESPIGEGGTEAGVAETIEISAPAGTDLEAVNAAIRADLPEGSEMRVLPGRTGHA